MSRRPTPKRPPSKRPMRRLLPLTVLLLLGGCGVVTGVASGAASLAGTAVDVAGTVATTSVDVVTAPIR